MIRALGALAILLACPAGARVLEGAITAQDGAGRFVLLSEPPPSSGLQRRMRRCAPLTRWQVWVLYLGHQMRGLEPGDRAWIDPGDRTLLWVDWAGSSPGDHLRAFTQGPPLM